MESSAIGISSHPSSDGDLKTIQILTSKSDSDQKAMTKYDWFPPNFGYKFQKLFDFQFFWLKFD